VNQGLLFDDGLAAAKLPEGLVYASDFLSSAEEAELLALVKKHEPALRKVGLVTAEPFRVLKAYDIRKQRELFVEFFEWRDGGASDIAHQTPEVMAVWEPMGPVLEELTICEVEPL